MDQLQQAFMGSEAGISDGTHKYNNIINQEDTNHSGMEIETSNHVNDQGQEDASVKRKLSDDGSADMDLDSPSKKPMIENNIRKLLPDLEKHWKQVEENPTDFNAWTFLLQYVDQETELLPAREAFDQFLARYTYCYGYWKKYADFEKRNGSPEDCEKVFQRGLKAIPLSIDLWIHYLNYIKGQYEGDQDFIRAKFKESVATCGLEFRSDKLWEHFIHWEKEVNALKNVLAIYDIVISTPTQSHLTHFQNMKSFIEENDPVNILSEKELTELSASLGPTDSSEEIENQAAKLKEKLLERRTEIYKKNEIEVNARWNFEEGIKRPYFHVKPLEKGQLRVWKEYLDYEVERRDEKRINALYERCLIACALYEEYWIKYITYLQAQPNKDPNFIRDVFIRCCTIYHQDKLWINLYWCAFEEEQGNFDKVNELFDKLEKAIPNSLHLYYKRIHFERRRGNLSTCAELFEKYIEATKGKITSTYLTIKYAYFMHYNLNDLNKSKELLQSIETDDEQLQATVLMALVDLGFRQRDASLIGSTFQKILESNVSNDIKINFAHRNIEFLEETTNDVRRIMQAHRDLQALSKLVQQKRAEEAQVATVPLNADKMKTEPTSGQATAPTAAPTSTEGYNGAAYNQYGSQSYSGWDQSQPPPNYQHQTPTNGASSYYSQQQQQQQQWGSYQQGYYG